MASTQMPKVGDFVKVVYYGVVTKTREGSEFLPHFELDNDCTRHALEEVSEITVYSDPAVDALMNSFARVSRDF